MTAVYPAGVKVQGNVKLQLVLAIANLSAPDLSSEINAGTSLDISCYVTAEGWNPSVTENKGEAPRRLCTTITRDQFGNAKYELADLIYAVTPQGAPASDGVKLWEAATPGLSAFIVERLGIDAVATDWTAGQLVNVWPITFGKRGPIRGDVTNEFAEFTVTQSLVVAGSGAPTERVALVA